tara:strand:+ start:983 stop:1096 length:114 start_codon:yes stop_codon:yes gene_type:complete
MPKLPAKKGVGREKSFVNVTQAFFGGDALTTYYNGKL